MPQSTHARGIYAVQARFHSEIRKNSKVGSEAQNYWHQGTANDLRVIKHRLAPSSRADGGASKEDLDAKRLAGYRPVSTSGKGSASNRLAENSSGS